jgi:hypothetical protein
MGPPSATHGTAQPSPSAAETTAPASPPSLRPVELFSGGGRILFEDEGGFAWLSRDGRVQPVFRGIGASLFPNGSRLLTWKVTREDNDYFAVDLDGSNAFHVAGPRPGSTVTNVSVSPNGAKVAYVRTPLSGTPTAPGRLLLVDLLSGERKRLGPIGPITSKHEVAWNADSLLIFFQSPNNRSIRWVRTEDGRRGTWLSVADPRIVRAYGRAWPMFDPPTEITPLGWSPDPRVLSFAALASGSNGSHPAVVALGPRGRVVASATDDAQPFFVEFEWARTGSRFTLLAVRSHRRQSTGTIYVGHAAHGHLHRLVTVRDRHAGPILSPDASIILFQRGTGPCRFVRTRIVPNACFHPANCPRRYPIRRMRAPGRPLLWA